MAETREIVSVINVDTQASVKSLKELRQEMDSAKNTLKDMKKNGQEYTTAYQQGLVDLKNKQADYNQTMRIAAKEVTSVKGSYNDLVNQLTILKEEWKRTAPNTAAYDSITKKVNEVKGALTQMDAEIGNYQRNVGNYQSVWAAMPPQLGKVKTAIASVNTAMKALAANPLIGVLTALAAVLGAVIKGFKSSEENMNSLKTAMAPFQGVTQGLTNVVQTLAKGLGKAAEGFTHLLDKLNLLSDRAKENQALTKMEIEIQKERRVMEVENARLETVAAENRMKANDSAHYSEKQRLEFLNKAEEANQQIMKNRIALAEKDLEIAKRRAEQTGNDSKTNDELAQKEAELYRVRTEYFTSMQRIESKQSTLTKSIEKETEATKELGVALADVNAKLSQGDKLLEQRRKDNEDLTKDIESYVAEENALLDEQITGSAQDILTQHGIEVKKTLQEQVASYQSYSASVSSIMQNVASAWAQSIKAQVEAGKISEDEGEKQFRLVKALEYGQTLINTAAGAVSVLTSPLYKLNPIGKWLEFAAVTSAGLANALTIKNTTLGASTSAGGSLGQAINTTSSSYSPAIIQQVAASTTPTGAMAEQQLNGGSSKVVLVWSDVQAMANQQQVQVQESGF